VLNPVLPERWQPTPQTLSPTSDLTRNPTLAGTANPAVPHLARFVGAEVVERRIRYLSAVGQHLRQLYGLAVRQLAFGCHSAVGSRQSAGARAKKVVQFGHHLGERYLKHYQRQKEAAGWEQPGAE